MIEFRLHEGKTQFRTWELCVAEDCHVVHVRESFEGKTRSWSIDWTEWKDVPISEVTDSYDYVNPPANSKRTIKMQRVPEFENSSSAQREIDKDEIEK